jgi:ergothioneine biosynthesis protein EgtB
MDALDSRTDADAATRHALAARLDDARRETDRIFALVRAEALAQRPIPERHRLIFYLGHLEAFDWNLLCRDTLGRKPFEPAFDRLFAFGIDPTNGNLPQDTPSDWPAVDAVRRYGTRARRAVDEALATTPLDASAHEHLRGGWAFHIAIEHRLMHAETLAYLLHQLPYEAKTQGPLPTPAPPSPPRRMVEIPAGRARLGLDRRQDPWLGWDNEYDAHHIDVPAFAIESHDVTWNDYLAFIESGAYDDPAFWSAEDWAWKTRTERAQPLFVARYGEDWIYRGMFGEVPLGPSWPAYVSHAEAAAFVRWRGQALPTEAQLHRATYGSPDGRERAYPWGDGPPASRHGQFGFQSWDPAPVGSHPAGDSAFGVTDLLGNGWKWTSTLFAPFPGFVPLPFYPGYSADFFDERHYVMKGGSVRTDPSLLRRSFRNWFQPHYPYVYATFRAVEARS